jgi:hypothetical protein
MAVGRRIEDDLPQKDAKQQAGQDGQSNTQWFSGEGDGQAC